MSHKPRYVFDTNAIVSALLSENSVPGQAFHAALDCGVLLLSQATIEELREVLSRAKFDRYLTREEREQFLLVFLQESTVIEIAEDVQACRDPKDDKFLALAVNGKAACLISGDADLLALHPFRDVPILTPLDFLTTLKRESESS